jgi:hypothetical protein
MRRTKKKPGKKKKGETASFYCVGSGFFFPVRVSPFFFSSNEPEIRAQRRGIDRRNDFTRDHEAKGKEETEEKEESRNQLFPLCWLGFLLSRPSFSFLLFIE